MERASLPAALRARSPCAPPPTARQLSRLLLLPPPRLLKQTQPRPRSPSALVARRSSLGFFLASLSPQRRYSVVGIETSETYERGRPKAKGLSDPKLGTLDRSMKCSTDGANSIDCPGYFGHLELAKPVFHVGFMTTILKVLRCVSVSSSKLLLSKARGPPRADAPAPRSRPAAQDDAKYRELMRIRNPKIRLRKFVDACRGKHECPETAQPQPAFRMEGCVRPAPPAALAPTHTHAAGGRSRPSTARRSGPRTRTRTPSCRRTARCP